MSAPHYPEIQVSTASPNPLALVAMIRQALRRAQVGQKEIDRFTEQALSKDDPRWRRRVCRDWVQVQ